MTDTAMLMIWAGEYNAAEAVLARLRRVAGDEIDASFLRRLEE